MKRLVLVHKYNMHLRDIDISVDRLDSVFYVDYAFFVKDTKRKFVVVASGCRTHTGQPRWQSTWRPFLGQRKISK